MKMSKVRSNLYTKGRKNKQKELSEKEIKRLQQDLINEKIPEDQRVQPKITKREQLTAELIAYYRERPDVCCEELLGIKLNLYQKVLIRGSWKKKFVMWLMSRGLGKSWLAMVFLVLKAILYPDLLIGIISPTYSQSRRVLLDKFEREILRDAPFLMQEYKDFPKSQDNTSVTFHNRSRIKAVSSGQGDNSSQRGDRFQILLADEYAQLKKDVIDRVVNPSMNNKAGYKVGKNADDMVSNQLIIASTTYYRFNHLWSEFNIYFQNMLNNDKNYCVFAFPYQVGIDVGLFEETFINKEKQRLSKDDFDMEYGCQFPAIGENSWIDPNDLEKCAKLDRFYFEGDNTSETVISVDVARTENKDNSCFHVGKLIPKNDGEIEIELVRTITMNGARFEEQHKVLRDLLKDYPNTIRIYMDIQGVGKGLYDESSKVYFDVELQKELPPLIALNDEQAIRNIPNGIKMIYGIAASQELNHKMGMSIKKYTQKGWLHMYHSGTVSATGADLTIIEKAQLMEAEATRRELMKIEATPQGNYLKFDLPKSMQNSKTHRKDRWSALIMLLHGVERIKEERMGDDDEDFCLGMATRF